MERALIIGASRGLGRELVKQTAGGGLPTVGVGRRYERLTSLSTQFPIFNFIVADVSTRQGQDEVIRNALTEDYSKIFYVAGGGPYGNFGDHEWEDHLWSLEVSFLAPARLLHGLAVAGGKTQTIVVGSAVAESTPDPRAASYCAAKSALRGLVLSLRGEYPNWDLRLFSPGYMDTEMLPAGAEVRKLGVYSPEVLARELWTWSLSADVSGHRLYPKHPN